MTTEIIKVDEPKKQNDMLDDLAKTVRRAQLFAVRILNKSKAANIEITNSADAAKILQSLASLSRACAEIEKIKLDRDGAIKLALESLSADIKARLKNRPDLYDEVRKEIYGAKLDAAKAVRSKPYEMTRLEAIRIHEEEPED